MSLCLHIRPLPPASYLGPEPTEIDRKKKSGREKKDTKIEINKAKEARRDREN